MKLHAIRIQNFKSLRDVTIRLQDVNLFIGPNNSGKSNALKAITLLLKMLNKEYIDLRTIFKKDTNNIVSVYFIFGSETENYFHLKRVNESFLFCGYRSDSFFNDNFEFKEINEYREEHERNTINELYRDCQNIIIYNINPSTFSKKATDRKSVV